MKNPEIEKRLGKKGVEAADKVGRTMVDSGVKYLGSVSGSSPTSAVSSPGKDKNEEQLKNTAAR